MSLRVTGCGLRRAQLLPRRWLRRRPINFQYILRPCLRPGNVGWDFATGIGTINAANLVNNWPTSSSQPSCTLSASPASLAFLQGRVGLDYHHGPSFEWIQRQCEFDCLRSAQRSHCQLRD